MYDIYGLPGNRVHAFFSHISINNIKIANYTFFLFCIVCISSVERYSLYLFKLGEVYRIVCRLFNNAGR